MVKLAHRKKTRAPIQIGVGSNIVAPTRTSQGNSILRAIWFNGQAYFAGVFCGPLDDNNTWEKELVKAYTVSDNSTKNSRTFPQIIRLE
jgi:hypothetical protein